MAAELGGGIYDDYLNTLMWKTKGKLICLIILGGERGNGFSVAAYPEMVHMLPDVLRKVANDIERGT